MTSRPKTRAARFPCRLTAQLKARYDGLNAGSIVLRTHEDDRLVFTSPEGGELDYSNWRIRRWNRLLEATAPDAKHPKQGLPVLNTRPAAITGGHTPPGAGPPLRREASRATPSKPPVGADLPR